MFPASFTDKKEKSERITGAKLQFESRIATSVRMLLFDLLFDFSIIKLPFKGEPVAEFVLGYLSA